MDALTKVIQFIADQAERLIFWVIVDEGTGGVLLRLGKYARTLKTGFNLKWPVLDVGLTIDTALTTLTVGPQSLITKDGKAFVVSAVLKYRVRDPKPLCCDIANEVEALSDISAAAVKHTLATRTWNEVIEGNGNLEREILQAIRGETNAWGFKCYSLIIVDLSPMKSLRLLQEPQLHLSSND